MNFISLMSSGLGKVSAVFRSHCAPCDTIVADAGSAEFIEKDQLGYCIMEAYSHNYHKAHTVLSD